MLCSECLPEFKAIISVGILSTHITQSIENLIKGLYSALVKILITLITMHTLID